MTLIRTVFREGRPIRAAHAARLGAVAIAILAIAACDDPYSPRADRINESQSFQAYALTGTPINSPSAMSLGGKTIVRVDGSFDFDLAFDIDAQGQAIILPVGMVGTPISGSHFVGMQRVPGPYDNVSEAPREGYVFDSTQVAVPGAVFIVQSQTPVCQFSLTPFVFAKITIDSVRTSTRQVFGRALINLNCGFRQLSTGLPTF